MRAAAPARGIVPQWTVPLREQTSGLDHLGLGSVGNQQILVRLLPDIYVQTVHPGSRCVSAHLYHSVPWHVFLV